MPSLSGCEGETEVAITGSRHAPHSLRQRRSIRIYLTIGLWLEHLSASARSVWLAAGRSIFTP